MKRFKDALTWLCKAGEIISVVADAGKKVINLIEE